MIFMDIYKLDTKHFSLIFTLLSCCFLASSQINIWLLKKFQSINIFQTALLLQIFISIIIFVMALSNAAGLTSTVVLFVLVLSCIGSIMPNATALALAPFSHNIGSASALMGFLQLGISSIISSLIGLLNTSSMLPVALLLVLTTITAGIILFKGRNKIAAV